MDTAGNAYLAIDADGHVHEDAAMFRNYLAPAFRSRAPGLELNADHAWRFLFDGVEHPPFPAEISIRKPMTADDRIKVLEKERIWSVMLFPSGALVAPYACEPAFAQAVLEAYLQWMADYVAPFRDRLYFAAPVALDDPGWAERQARRAVERGARAITVRPNRRAGEVWDDPAYDRFYACVAELGVPLIFHESTGDPSTAGADRYGIRNAARYAFNHIISHSFEQMFATMSLICGGVLERFPRLRVGMAEAGCSWVPYWLARLDDHFGHRVMGRQMPIKLRPSDFFRRQCFVTCEPEDETLRLAIAGIGAGNILFSTDYPHFDSGGNAVKNFLALEGVTPADARRILWDNAAAIYGMTLPAPA